MRNLLMVGALTLCWGVVCVPPQIKNAAQINAKYMERYVEYANKKIEASPDDKAEEMVVIGRKLKRNTDLVNELFNGKPSD